MAGSDSVQQNETERAYSRTLIIYVSQWAFALAASVAGWFLVPVSAGSGSYAFLWVFILFLAVGVLVARRALTAWTRLKDIKLLRGADGLLSALQTNTIILAALAEAIALTGLASAWLTGDRTDILRAAVISTVLFAIIYPRRQVWQTIFESLKDV